MLGTPLLLGDDGYTISRSVRLRSSASAYFSRTPSSSGNMKTWTWSAWVKRGLLSQTGTIWGSNFASGGFGMAFGNYGGAGVNPQLIGVTLYAVGTVTTNAVFRDSSAWYHIVARFDSTQATQADRFRLYVNGVQQTLSANLNVTLNADYHVNASGRVHTLGGESGYNNDCYLAEINHVDGQSLDPSSFGETDAITGVWKPKKYSGVYGTNGFYLNFSDPSAASASAIGKDYSGNGNNWTPTNISVTAGTTYDSMIDVPTMWADGNSGRGNYATLNPLRYSTNGSLSEANLKYSNGSGDNGAKAIATMGISSGKWYFESQWISGPSNSRFNIGFSSSTTAVTGASQLFEKDGSNLGLAANDIANVAIDFDAGKIWYGKNNVWQASGDPATGANPAQTFTPSSYDFLYPGLRLYSASDGTSVGVVNFGQRPFTYTPPTGFKALNTQNLPDPTIKKGSQYFDISTWTGNQSARTITNSGMQPDFLWTKSRSAAEDHRLSDAVRGGNGTVLGTLASNTQGVEAFDTDVTGFTSGGFNIRAGTNSPNVTGRTYVGWQWKEGATPGFDIVTYTGTGTARTVSHSLGATPAMMIVKSRSYAGSDWDVYHSALGATKRVFLNSTAAAQTTSVAWNDTAPTSSVFTVGTGSNVNANTQTYVAYLFAEVAGFSKFGSYTGNGSSDGPFVFTGFRPRWVMVKKTNSTGSWAILDSARDTYNQGFKSLYPDLSNTEVTIYDFRDFLSNGFKLRTTDQNSNGNGDTYIYAAFAENPFKYSLAR